MNYPIIFKLLSVIMAALVLAMGVSLGLAYYYQHDPAELNSVQGFTFAVSLAAVLSLVFYLIGRTGDNTMFRKEALSIIGLGWIVASAVGALPYLFIVDDFSLADAFFEAASGFTTTGASVMTEIEGTPRSLLFWRSMTQWFGGLGVIVFFVAILSFLGAGAKILFSRESSAQAADLNSARVQTGIYRLLYCYLGLSALCMVVYWLCGLSWFDAINHMFTTMSTGGFGTRNTSIAAFENPLLEWMVILFMMLGGTSFIVILRSVALDWGMVRKASEVKFYYLIIGAATLAIILLTLRSEADEGLHAVVRGAAFQVVSIMTTTGFATEDFDKWVPATHVILLFLMALGGCSGSTGGGVKVVRVVVATKVAWRHIEKAYRAHVIRSTRMNDRVLDRDAQDEIMTFLVLIGFIAFISCVVVAILEPGMSFKGSISAVFASLFNIGPGFAEVGPTQNFAFMHDYTKTFLAFLMIAGRLELYAILVLLSPQLWRKF